MKNWWSVATVILAACGSVTGDTHPDGGGSNATGASLSLAKTTRWVPQGRNVTVPFTVTRTSSQGDLTVHVVGLPAGVTVDDVTVAAGATSGMLTFTATSGATLGSVTDSVVHLADGAAALDMKTFTVKVSGAPGTLDSTFGTAGRRVMSLPDPVLAATTGSAVTRRMLVYPASAGANAGKIVAAANLETSGTAGNTHKYVIVRFNADGSTDTTFGAGLGYVLLSPGDSHGVYVTGLALDSQERIVFTGSHQDTADVCRVYTARLLPTGALDTSFTQTDINPPGGYCGRPDTLVMLPGDKFESVNNWNNPDGSQLVNLLAYGSDGQPDSTAFAGNTYSMRMGAVASGKTYFEQNSSALDNGKIIVAGLQCAGGWNTAYSACESVVARIKSDGAWDTSFGTNGYTALSFGTNNATHQQFVGMTLDSAKNIIAVGYNEGATTGTIMKIKSDGSLDMSFGTSGRLAPTLVAGGTQFGFYDVVADEEDRLLVTGYSNSGGALLVSARYMPDGTLDSSYGTNGFSTTPTGAVVWRSALQPDGRLIVVGSYPRTGGGWEMAAWRLWP